MHVRTRHARVCLRPCSPPTPPPSNATLGPCPHPTPHLHLSRDEQLGEAASQTGPSHAIHVHSRARPLRPSPPSSSPSPLPPNPETPQGRAAGRGARRPGGHEGPVPRAARPPRVAARGRAASGGRRRRLRPRLSARPPACAHSAGQGMAAGRDVIRSICFPRFSHGYSLRLCASVALDAQPHAWSSCTRKQYCPPAQQQRQASAPQRRPSAAARLPSPRAPHPASLQDLMPQASPRPPACASCMCPERTCNEAILNRLRGNRVHPARRTGCALRKPQETPALGVVHAGRRVVWCVCAATRCARCCGAARWLPSLDKTSVPSDHNQDTRAWEGGARIWMCCATPQALASRWQLELGGGAHPMSLPAQMTHAATQTFIIALHRGHARGYMPAALPAGCG